MKKFLLIAVCVMALPLLCWGQENDARLEQARAYVESENWLALRQMGEQDVAQGNPDGYALLAICDAQQKGDKKAVATLKKGVAKGSMDCIRSLVSYYNGNNQHAKAYALMEKHQTAENQYRMARLILQGKVKKKGLEQALSLLNQSADGGSTDALELLGYIYSSDDFGLENPVVAKGYYQRLADAGESEGLFMIGQLYEAQGNSAQCLAYYRRAAEAGHGDAWRFLGEFYMRGQWLPCDSVEAFRCYTRAMELGHPAGYDFVGQCHLRGVGVEKDTLQALPYIRQAALRGVGRDCVFMAEAYGKGLYGLEKDADSSFHYYKIGSDNDDPECDYQMGLAHLHAGSINAYGFISSAARNGHAGAQVLIIELLMGDVTATEADYERLYQLLEQLAFEERNADAFLKMGAYRCFGKGCRQDYALARLYFDTAAQMGNTVAMGNLASMYFEGMGMAADSARAIAYLEQAAALGSADAMNRLGDYYEARGDYRQAVSWYERGVEMEDPTAMCNLGVCYQEGNGVTLNSQKAYELFLQAAEGGSARGMYHVGMCYMDEVYVSDDIDQAILWLSRAADEGHTLSCYILGLLYANGAENSQGQALKPDKKKAKLYLQQAAEAEFQPAIEALKKL